MSKNFLIGWVELVTVAEQFKLSNRVFFIDLACKAIPNFLADCH